jgi:hypothetical protein
MHKYVVKSCGGAVESTFSTCVPTSALFTGFGGRFVELFTKVGAFALNSRGLYQALSSTKYGIFSLLNLRFATVSTRPITSTTFNLITYC